MAIDTAYREADNLAKPQKTFYPVRIPVSHWQLRHYISHPEPDHVYYASGADVYFLNTATKKRKRIASIPFDARCTASGHGWICVGGEEDGRLAAIKLDGSRAAARTLDVDAALPIGGRVGASDEEGRERRAVSVRIERIGEEIMNSISIHRIEEEDAHLYDTVAVVTNNDRTVRVYSLLWGQETAVLDLPFAMNHATLSPDGKTLVAVGDFNQAYFFKREIQDEPPQIPKPHNRLTSSSLEWKLAHVVTLHGAKGTVGYFTTAWAPSGRLVAVGSEGGYIQVFDLELLDDPELEDQEAIVATVAGSRPDLPFPHKGAIRSIMFSPEPWDLLIWAEDSDRVCIGDLRTGLQTRQVINLEPGSSSLHDIETDEIYDDEPVATGVFIPRSVEDLEAEFIRRYRHSPDNATAVNFATEYIEARRRQRQQRQQQQQLQQVQLQQQQEFQRRRLQGLSREEEQMLDTLRTSRQREEARAGGGPPRSVNYPTGDMFRSPPRSGSETPDSQQPIGEILSAVQESFPELARTQAATGRPESSDGVDNNEVGLPRLARENPDTRESGGMFFSQRRPTVRVSDGSRLSRARVSVILSGSPGQPDPDDHPPGTSTSPPPETRPSAPPDGPSPDNPWRTIEDHMSMTRGPLFESAITTTNRPSIRPAATTAFTDRPSDTDILAIYERSRSRDASDRNPALPSADRERVEHHINLAADRARQRQRARDSALTQSQDAAMATLLRRSRLRSNAGSTTGLVNVLSAERDAGTRTAGLAMSADGRALWVACEQGIFEVEIGVKRRMFWSSVEAR